jgi:hypothetical protein
MELPRQFKTWADRRTRTCRLKYKEQFCYASNDLQLSGLRVWLGLTVRGMPVS